MTTTKNASMKTTNSLKSLELCLLATLTIYLTEILFTRPLVEDESVTNVKEHFSCGGVVPVAGSREIGVKVGRLE